MQAGPTTLGAVPVSAVGQVPQGGSPYRLADRGEPLRPMGPPQLGPAQANEHPLMPALRWAREGMKAIDANIHDYSATVVKRERLGDKLGDYQYMFVKIRHHPFSVYAYFLGPPSDRGQEVIYVQGKTTGSCWPTPSG